MIFKTFLFCIFVLLIVASVVQAYENDLNFAETVAKKAVITGSALTANKKGVLIANGNKLAKG